ncbi:PREDICTED: uncharacterized protein LOC104783488 [Camelina sativa]|uniref:Uncharacterized protein LOC104783488 n=1 Tax=Camelina sativa TaxID=90675 RepID=A0ABM0YWL1_CAMSA|nr:PREDICTED: uncharacterized protein LOC104783488 [Camelina sativa]
MKTNSVEYYKLKAAGKKRVSGCERDEVDVADSKEHKQLNIQTEEYYALKAAGKRKATDYRREEGELIGSENGDEEDEQYRFDCCDDSDGASSGDEECGLAYKLLAEGVGEGKDDGEDMEEEAIQGSSEDRNASVVPVHVAEALNLRYGLKVDYWKGHRKLKRARELVRGSYENGYAELPGYLYRIRRSNPGTMTRLKVDENDRFKSVFISFGASIDGFKFMRKVIVVDGTFLNGKYLGTCVIPDDDGIVIISDIHKSIGKAVDRIYPLANRGICTYHLHKNIMLRFRGSETFRLVKQAVTAYRLADFNVLVRQIEEMNLELYAYLQRADVSKWSRVHFPGDRYNITTTNIAESLNKVLRPARQFPIVQLLDEERVRQASFLQVQEIDSHHYEVRSGSSVNVVNLSQRRCSCRVFDVDKIPCIHAIAAAEKANVSRISKCHPYFRVDYLRSGYAKSIMPKDTSCQLPLSVTEKSVIPPYVRTQSERPKLCRIKGPFEVAMERKRPRKPHACSNCGHIGHNRMTCIS